MTVIRIRRQKKDSRIEKGSRTVRSGQGLNTREPDAEAVNMRAGDIVLYYLVPSKLKAAVRKQKIAAEWFRGFYTLQPRLIIAQPADGRLHTINGWGS